MYGQQGSDVAGGVKCSAVRFEHTVSACDVNEVSQWVIPDAHVLYGSSPLLVWQAPAASVAFDRKQSGGLFSASAAPLFLVSVMSLFPIARWLNLSALQCTDQGIRVRCSCSEVSAKQVRGYLGVCTSVEASVPDRHCQGCSASGACGVVRLWWLMGLSGQALFMRCGCLNASWHLIHPMAWPAYSVRCEVQSGGWSGTA